MKKNNVISIDEFRKSKENRQNPLAIKKSTNQRVLDEDRKKTFNLFMKVLETMRKESY